MMLSLIENTPDHRESENALRSQCMRIHLSMPDNPEVHAEQSDVSSAIKRNTSCHLLGTFDLCENGNRTVVFADMRRV